MPLLDAGVGKARRSAARAGSTPRSSRHQPRRDAWTRRAAIGAAGAVAALAIGLAAAPSAQARSETIVLRSKPFVLTSFGTIFPKVGVPSPARTGYVTQMDARLVYANGRRVSIRQVMLHHVVFINDGFVGGQPKRTTCRGRNGEPFWGTGEERQPLLLPTGYGYRVNARDHWRMQAMLMRHRLGTRRVRVEYRVRIVTGRRLARVKPLWLRANGCSTHPSYEIFGEGPSGSTHRKEHLWRMPVSGRIVAASAHLHGSSSKMTIKQPRCDDRTLVDHRPLFGRPDDLVYRVRPLLHEPGPIATGHFLSKSGLPVRQGEPLRVTGIYDRSRPHSRVMAITHVYVAIDRNAPRRCAPRPRDARIHWTRRDGTPQAPVVTVPLNAVDGSGRVLEIDRPPGHERVVSGANTAVHLRRSLFVPANLSVRAARGSAGSSTTARSTTSRSPTARATSPRTTSAAERASRRPSTRPASTGCSAICTP